MSCDKTWGLVHITIVGYRDCLDLASLRFEEKCENFFTWKDTAILLVRNIKLQGVWLSLLVEHVTLNLGVVGLSPTFNVVKFTLKIFLRHLDDSAS